MPPRIRTALKVVAVGFFTLVFLIVYAVYTLTRPKQVFEFTSGRIGDLQLGETKEQILSRLSVGSTAAPAGKQVFSPQPKPAECPVNWIEVSAMSSTEKNCLLKTDVWVEGHSSSRHLCKEPADVHTELRFEANQLAKVTTECWHPK
jgi:hypothetical protein